MAEKPPAAMTNIQRGKIKRLLECAGIPWEQIARLNKVTVADVRDVFEAMNRKVGDAIQNREPVKG
jgi:hypothetical protein